jgi:hypothetical protein
VVPLAELQKARQTTDDGQVIPVSAATRLTEGAFSVARMQYWEEVGCPFLDGKRLTVVCRDAIVPATFKGKKTTRVVKDAKHYVRSEILEAWQNFKRLAERKGIHVDEQGDTWLTVGAAFRKYGVRDQAVRHWRDKGLLDAQWRPRHGSGRYKETCYFREMGERGIAGLVKRQRPGDGHVVIDKSEVAPSAEHKSSATTERPKRPLESPEPSYKVRPVNKPDDPLHVRNLHLEKLVEELGEQVRKLTPAVAQHLIVTPDGNGKAESQPESKCRKRGRPTSEQTEAVYKFCYEHYVAGQKLLSIREKAARVFGNRAPKEDAHVTEYAKRYAKRNRLPLNRKT